ncbi:MAG: hypothetical protein QM817_31085 [Archangium sp.]
MAPREKPLSAARRLEKSLPKLSPLMREAYASMWSEDQCAAWGRRTKGVEVAKQANEWLLVADGALKKAGAEDVPWSRQRLAWVASLTVQLENELAGKVDDEIAAAKTLRDERLAAAKQLRARVLSRLSLLVGGDGARGAALKVANKGARTVDEVVESLKSFEALLTHWRKEARLRLLADELHLDEAVVAQLAEMRDSLSEAELSSAAVRPLRGDSPSLNVVEGRVLRELRALQLAFDTAREEGLNVPRLKVHAAVKALLSGHE